MGMITNDWLEAIQPEFSKPITKNYTVLLKMNIVKR